MLGFYRLGGIYVIIYLYLLSSHDDTLSVFHICCPVSHLMLLFFGNLFVLPLNYLHYVTWWIKLELWPELKLIMSVLSDNMGTASDLFYCEGFTIWCHVVTIFFCGGLADSPLVLLPEASLIVVNACTVWH